jgi:hypothetical protein
MPEIEADAGMLSLLQGLDVLAAPEKTRHIAPTPPAAPRLGEHREILAKLPLSYARRPRNAIITVMAVWEM